MVAPDLDEVLPEVVLQDRHGRRGEEGCAVDRIGWNVALLPTPRDHKIDLALHVLEVNPERVCGEEIRLFGGNAGDVCFIDAFECL